MSGPAITLIAAGAVCAAATFYVPSPQRVWPRYVRAAARWLWSRWPRRLTVVATALVFVGCASVQDDNVTTPAGTVDCGETSESRCHP